MKVIIRFPYKKEMEIQGGRKLLELLEELGIDMKEVIVLKGYNILKESDIVEENDTIEILPIILGG